MQQADCLERNEHCEGCAMFESICSEASPGRTSRCPSSEGSDPISPLEWSSSLSSSVRSPSSVGSVPVMALVARFSSVSAVSSPMSEGSGPVMNAVCSWSSPTRAGSIRRRAGWISALFVSQ
eukprot:5049364-Pyramimonas_sp.AAC.1